MNSRTNRRFPIVLTTAALVVPAVGVISGVLGGSALAATPNSYAVAGQWNMNETGGSVMNDSGPHDLDGNIGDDVTVGVNVQGAVAYRFPRVAKPSEEPANPERLATVPSDPRLNPDDADYAIEFRYRTTRNFGNIVQKGQNATWGGYFKFEQPKGRMTCLFKYNPPGGGTSSQKGVKAPVGMETNDGQWHTIRCELRRSFGVILFIDGVEAAKNGWGGGPPLPAIANKSPISIGGKSGCDQIEVTCDYFDGDIDYVRIEKGASTPPPPPPPNQPPQMAFSASCDDLDCSFDAGASTDSDGNIVGYQWDYGDGGVRTDDDPNDTHTYAAPGTYTVTLTGLDDDGATGETSQDVVVSLPNAPPVASFTVSCTELACAVDGSKSTDGDGTITSYAWTFGDGTNGSGVTSGHTYATAGTYTVELTATDDDGATSSTTKQVTVAKQASLPPAPDATKMVPLPPARIFDTRATEAAPGPKGLVAGGTTIEVDVTDIAGVPEDAAAVAVNLTAIGLEPGFVTAWPTGLQRPTASNINLVSAGQVRANLVVVPVGADGTISLYTLGDAHLLGDIAGYFADQSAATRAGRIVTQTPQRLFDTRTTEPGPGPKGTLAAGGTIDVAVLGQAGLPQSGVSAVVLNVTATVSHDAGFVTTWSGDGTQPTASIINLNGPNETVPNQVVVPVGTNGSIRFYSSTATELLADVTGYVTDTTAEPSVSGLFVPLPPDRAFDTRPGEPAGGPKGLVAQGATITPAIAGVAGVPADAGGVILNVTMVGTAPSFATAWPADAPQPGTSVVNVAGAGDVRANSATLALGAGGDVSLFASEAAHLIGDVAGYLVG